MKVGSLFAGVGGFDLAAEAAGMTVAFQSEYDNHASRVLDHHWPNLNLGDIHDITDHPTVDVLCGGFPCQDYSVAGNRSGLAGDRGALWWEFHRLIAEGRPEWVVGENVPGILSSRGGRDFATIIDSLTDIGYRVGWRVLDAQYFGVPQRRRRLFIVATTGEGSPAKVLALAQGMQRYSHPSGKEEEGAARKAARAAGGSSFHIQAELIGRSPDSGPNGKGFANLESDPAYTLNVAGGVQAIAFNAAQDPDTHDDISPPLIAGAHTANPIGVVAARMTAFGEYTVDETASTLKARDYKDATDLIAFTQNQRDEVRELGDRAGALAAEPGMKQQTYVATYDELNDSVNTDIHHSLRAGTKQSTGVIQNAVVRRLTPTECERLQGFPDGWTDIPKASDAQRYKQMGNAVAVPVVTWIMKRIALEQRGEL